MENDFKTGMANIKVIGVGGAGNNGVNGMVEAELKNTDILNVDFK